MRHPAILLIILAVGCIRHVEYIYAHTVTGVVIDADARPVVGARVKRVQAGDENIGNDNDTLYVTTTDARGRFEFRYSGLAGEPPRDTDTWLLIARDEHGGMARKEVLARWSCTDKHENSCPGFHADVVLQLKASAR